ncbi:MAG: MYXO-CTERM sorting domain-containing protein [bacterium]
MGTDEPSCSCAPSGDSYCRLIEVECTTDTDCASGLTCQDVYGETTVVDPDGSTGTDPMPAPAPDPVSYCAPVGYGYWGGPTGSDVIANEAGVAGDAELASADRISWGENGPSGSGSKGSSSACSTTGGDASLTLLGLIGLVGFLRRR